MGLEKVCDEKCCEEKWSLICDVFLFILLCHCLKVWYGVWVVVHQKWIPYDKKMGGKIQNIRRWGWLV